MAVLSADDHARVSAAIAAAETQTSGEIFCIVTDSAGDSAVVPLLWAGFAAVAAPLVWLALGAPLPDAVHALFGWASGQRTALTDGVHAGEQARLVAMALLPLLAFLLVWALVSFDVVTQWLTPRSLRRVWVHRAALEQFLARGLHQTEERTGILIFLSTGDRHAEIIADDGIYARVEPHLWGEAVAALVAHAGRGAVADGFIAAIGLAGDVLAQHFPPRATNANELPDKLVEL